MKTTVRAATLAAFILTLVSVVAAQNNRPHWAVSSQDANQNNASSTGTEWWNSGEYEVMGDFNNPHFPTYAPPNIDPDTVKPYKPQRMSSVGNVTNEQITITENKWHFMKTSLPKWKKPGIPPSGYADEDGYAWVVLPANSRVDVEGDAPKFYRGTADGKYLDCHNEDVVIAERLPEESFNVPPQQPRPPAINYPTVAQNTPYPYPPMVIKIENSPTMTNENHNKNNNTNVLTSITKVAQEVRQTIRDIRADGGRQSQNNPIYFPQERRQERQGMPRERRPVDRNPQKTDTDTGTGTGSGTGRRRPSLRTGR